MSIVSQLSDMYPCLLVLLFLSTFQLVCVESYNLTMSPDHLRISWRPENVSFTCSADAALSGCQFILWDYGDNRSPVLDLSQGSLSQTNSTNMDGFLRSYGYSGQGLGVGDCGITMQVTGVNVWIVACRVRANTGGWTYAWSDLDADGYTHFPHKLTPRESVVLPGGEARFMLKAQDPLDLCYFHRLPWNLILHLGEEFSNTSERYRYIGGGLGEGECGLALTNVSEADNGLIRSYLRNEEGAKVGSRFMVLIIAKLPTAPSLTIVQDNNSLNATCTVENGRPLPQITWLLGDDVIRQNTLDDSLGDPLDDWRWPWMQGSLTQRVTVGLKPRDNGKILKCLVSHATLDQPLEVNERISVSTTCPPLTSSSKIISCHSGGQEVNCTKPQPIGSWVEVSCKPGYVAFDAASKRRINCTDSGEWDQSFFCRPDCGRRKTNDGQLNIFGGEEARVGEFPWHVAIYEKSNNAYTQICGGSLISTRIVISAAHCFWSERYSRKKDSIYEVAAGKHKRAWLDAEDNNQVQRRRVEVITIPPLYHGRHSSFQADIALVRLSAPVDITVNVNTVCVDWGNLWEESQLQPGVNGTVPGWGYTEGGQLSTVLKHVELPYVDHDTCYNELDEEHKPLITFDKFCAGYANLSISTCRGDSGGGLVFLRQSSNRYYLRGLLSISLKPASNKEVCYAQSYTAFTLVSTYHWWMRNHGI